MLVVFVGSAGTSGNLSDGLIGGIVAGAVSVLFLLLVVSIIPVAYAVEAWVELKRTKELRDDMADGDVLAFRDQAPSPG